MRAIGTWLLRLTLLAVAAATVLAVVVVARFQAPPAPLDGQTVIAGADGPIEIVRDQHGVPHIFATTEADLYRGLGFAHAQDRLFQMDGTRRFMQGRLAELIGDAGLESDAQARIMDWAGVARAQLARLTPEMRALLEAYAEGVNAELAIGPTPPEYALFFDRPAPWSAEDSMAASLAMVDQLTVPGFDRARVRLARRLSPEQIEQFLADYPDWAPRSYEEGSFERGRSVGGGGLESEAPGSNAWVVAPSRTGTGAAVLANDPHLPLGAPGPFYLARLQGPDGPVIGATLPGVPMVVIGRNDAVAWGMTTHQTDVADEIPLTDDMAVREETATIRVRTLLFFHRTESIQLRRTEEGPVLDARWFDLDDTYGDQPRVLRTIADDVDNGVSEAFFRASKARSVADFFAAIAPWSAPPQNVVAADIEGNIGLASPGRFPARTAGGEWVGEIPFRLMAENPRQGFFATANNLQTPRDFPYPMPGTHDAYRVFRITEALAADSAHNADHAAALQADHNSILARRMRDAIASATPRTGPGLAMRERLGVWDGVADPNAVEPTMFWYWMRALGPALYADELGPELYDLAQGPRSAFLDAVMNGELPAAWCDNVDTTDAVESCADIAGKALDDAAAALREQRGAEERGWAWGQAHAARFRHPVLSGLPVVGDSFTVEVAVGGDASTVNVARNFFSRPGFNTVHGPGLRMIVDFSDLDASRFMLAPGQSGHPRSPHYGDLAPLWARVEYFQIRSDWTPDNPPEGAHVWRIAPAQ